MKCIIDAIQPHFTGASIAVYATDYNKMIKINYLKKQKPVVKKSSLKHIFNEEMTVLIRV